MQEQKKIIIALDGYSSCGKSTFARLIADKMNYTYVDTGAMYRAVTYFAMQSKLIENKKVNELELVSKLSEIEISFQFDAEGKQLTFLNGENVEDVIRTISVSENVSQVSTIKEVREALVEQQQKMGEKKALVMDGRDIGTVVFPNAELKIFMETSSEIRAERRYKELIEKGDKVNFEEIRENIESRDRIDETRDISPLRKADDAKVLDNGKMSLEDQMIWLDEQLNAIL